MKLSHAFPVGSMVFGSNDCRKPFDGYVASQLVSVVAILTSDGEEKPSYRPEAHSQTSR